MRFLLVTAVFAATLSGCSQAPESKAPVQSPLPQAGELTVAEFRTRVEKAESPITSREQLLYRVGTPKAIRPAGANLEIWSWQCSNGEARVRVQWRTHQGKPADEVGSLRVE
jgi:hypothetical protein